MQKKIFRSLTIVLIAAVFSGFVGCAKPVSYEILAARFTDALMRGDGEAALRLMPEEMLSYLSDQGGQSREEIARSLSDHFRQRLLSCSRRHGPIRSYTWRIKRFRDYPEEKLLRLNSRCQKYRFTADAAKELTLLITLTLENQSVVSVFFSLEIFRIGRSWYTDGRYWTSQALPTAAVSPAEVQKVKNSQPPFRCSRGNPRV